MRLVKIVGGAALAVGLAWAAPHAQGAQDAAILQAQAAPANGIWLDSLDQAPLAPGTIRRPPTGRGRRGAPPPTTPPPPPTYTLGGVTYPHTVPTSSDIDLTVDLGGAAARFMAMVGVDDGNGQGRAGGRAGYTPPAGTVVFGIWADGKQVADSGVMKRGDAPKLLSVDVSHVKRLTLGVNDANDGTGGDNADWGGALIEMMPGAQATPTFVAPAVEPAPAIAPSGSHTPTLNSPRITGATPGRPFMFMIPASGDAPLTFTARNLPAGVTLDPKTGLITGSLSAAGETVVDVTVTNGLGKATGQITIVGGDHKLALTPPLGWNSWNAWGNKVTADDVRAAADALVKSGLAREGYTYVNIDDTWEAGQRGQPDSGRDANGEIMTNEKFPDMKGLVDYIHGLGLKAGIYSSPGPTTCQGLPATFGHEEQDAQTWAKWGFDYIKYDWCSYQGDRNNLDDLKRPYIVMRKALDSLNRDLIFSLCQYGWGNVWEWGNEPDIRGNLWRMTGDITDTWPSMTGIGFQQTGHETYAGPGHWNDTDMLVVGMLGWGRSTGSRPTNLTPDEQLTHISLWALQAAPMLIGADMSKLDAWTTNLLGNRDVLAVNQDVLGKPASRLSSTGWTDVWARPLADGTMAVGLFNRSPEAASISVTLSDLGLSGRQPVRDLWQQKALAPASGTFTAMVPRHGVVLVKVGTPKS